MGGGRVGWGVGGQVSSHQLKACPPKDGGHLWGPCSYLPFKPEPSGLFRAMGEYWNLELKCICGVGKDREKGGGKGGGY